MHEMGLAHGILAVVLDVADQQMVRRVQLRVGALQRVSTESLEFSFQLLAQDTPAANAILELQEIPARWHCRRCAAESRFDLPPFVCRRCGADEVDLIAGDEVLVDGVELDDGWRRRPEEETPTHAAGDSLEHLQEHAYAAAAGADASGSGPPAT